MITSKALKELVDTMRELGVYELKEGDLHIKLGSLPVNLTPEEMKAREADDPEKEDPFIKYGHSGFIPQLIPGGD